MARSATGAPRAGAGALNAFVLASLFCSSAMAAAARINPSYIVKVRPGRLREVAQQYKQQGYVITDTQPQHDYLVVQPAQGSPSVVAAAAVPDRSPAVQGPWPAGQQLLSPDGATPLPGQARSYSTGQPDSTTVTAAAVQATVARLSSVNNVLSVDENHPLYLYRDKPATYSHHLQTRSSHARLLAAVQGNTASSSSSSNSVGSNQPAASCPASSTFYNPDAACGKGSECTPYGISLIQADDPVMVQVSQNFRDKLLFCVIDTGLDRFSDFDAASTNGCTPGNTRIDSSATNCKYNWYEDLQGHGTHTSGTIGARRNGYGVVGVSAEGAQIYHYNIFGANGSFDNSEMINAWYDCINELKTRQINTPDMKMVVSMSFGGKGYSSAVADAASSIAQSRPDVLFLAAAGNEGDGENYLSFPASLPEVVSVAAVDFSGTKAPFSTYNDDVEWAAPGVMTLSTYPTALAATSTYNMQLSVTLSPFTPPADYDYVLTSPKPQILEKSPLGTVSAELVDCGLGNATCVNATGKICLIQRGFATFCSKVGNCAAGGGKAALIYNSDDPANADCDPFRGTLDVDGCTNPGLLSLTVSRLQGQIVKNAMANGAITATLSTGTGGSAPFEFMSGTSMATPHAAGVAGLVWSAFTKCSTTEIRNAISMTAQDLGPSGRDTYYGFGLVKAKAAYNYLLENPCKGPPPNPSPSPSPSPSPGPSPQPPVNCVGSWSPYGPCVRAGTIEPVQCGGGVQYATYNITQVASNGGTACEAVSGAQRNQTCNTQECLIAQNDEVTAVAGRWTNFDALLDNDSGPITAVTVAQQATKGSVRYLANRAQGQGSAKPTFRYLGQGGFVGKDSFQYSISDANGQQQTATVKISVLPGSCDFNRCGPLGRCNSHTGNCYCPASSGLQPTFVINSNLTDRSVTPKVPGCRFESRVSLSPGKAAAGSTSLLPLTLTITCPQKAIIAGVAFSPTVRASCTTDAGAVQWAVSTSNVGQKSCSKGQYMQVVKVPQKAACYLVTVKLTDDTSRQSFVQVV